MLYRRKIILALLEIFGGEVSLTDFQKYLFLLSQVQENSSFEFIPYKFGCFSFSSYVDKRVLKASGMLTQKEDSWELAVKSGHLDQVSQSDRTAIHSIKKEFGALTGDELIRYVYKTYPYYATRSEIAKRILSDKEYRFMREMEAPNNAPTLFTIGYEGRSPEGFLNELLQRQIKMLCDVRRNAVSMKYGFSGKTLRAHCEDVGILYCHLPMLGIASERRKSLSTTIEFDKLFSQYQAEIPKETEALDAVLENLRRSKRVALMCFEREASSCHRFSLVGALRDRSAELPDVIHI